MGNWIRALDAVLRGQVTKPSQLKDGKLEIPVAGLIVMIALLGAAYGLCMGSFAIFNRETPVYTQPIASMLKVPALFLLTFFVTLPSLYVFNALVGSRLSASALVRLLVAAMGVTLAVLGSFGPIVAFFSATTTSYPFILILNVLFFAVAGFLGLGFLLRTANRLTMPTPVEPTTPAEVVEPGGALEKMSGEATNRNVRTVFGVWVVVFALVGAQMSWVLRPFIGAPDRPFEWLRLRESNFFEAVRKALAALFG